MARPSRHPDPQPPHDQIARRAYWLYVSAGRPPGHAVDHWLQAEAQLRRRPGRATASRAALHPHSGTHQEDRP